MAEVDYEKGLRFLAELVIPVLEDVLDEEDNADSPCDADDICGSALCRSGGCIVDKLRFARLVVETTGTGISGADWKPLEGFVRWRNMLEA